MAILSYIEAVTKALKDEMQRDEKVFVIGEDVGVRGGVFRATDGLIDLFGEERVIELAALRSAHRRGFSRRCCLRHAPGGRDPIRRFYYARGKPNGE